MKKGFEDSTFRGLPGDLNFAREAPFWLQGFLLAGRVVILDGRGIEILSIAAVDLLLGGLPEVRKESGRRQSWGRCIAG